MRIVRREDREGDLISGVTVLYSYTRTHISSIMIDDGSICMGDWKIIDYFWGDVTTRRTVSAFYTDPSPYGVGVLKGEIFALFLGRDCTRVSTGTDCTVLVRTLVLVYLRLCMMEDGK